MRERGDCADLFVKWLLAIGNYALLRSTIFLLQTSSPPKPLKLEKMTRISTLTNRLSINIQKGTFSTYL